jgi:hypothetical protein
MYIETIAAYDICPKYLNSMCSVTSVLATSQARWVPCWCDSWYEKKIDSEVTSSPGVLNVFCGMDPCESMVKHTDSSERCV